MLCDLVEVAETRELYRHVSTGSVHLNVQGRVSLPDAVGIMSSLGAAKKILTVLGAKAVLRVRHYTPDNVGVKTV